MTIYSDDAQSYNQLKESLSGYNNWLLLMDENTKLHCSSIFLDKLGLQPQLRHHIKAGEENKSLSEVSRVYEKLLKSKFDRKSAIVNLGGACPNLLSHVLL